MEEVKEKPDLVDLLERQCNREMRLRQWKGDSNVPEKRITQSEELVEKGNQELKFHYSDLEIEDEKKEIYLEFLEREIDRIKAKCVRPYCPVCWYMYRYPDGKKFESKNDECSIYGNRPDEMMKERIAFCETFARMFGSSEQEEKEFSEELDMILEFKREIEVWKQ